MEALLASNNEEIRGKIKFIDEMLRLPEDLQNEAIDLKKAIDEQ